MILGETGGEDHPTERDRGPVHNLQTRAVKRLNPDSTLAATFIMVKFLLEPEVARRDVCPLGPSCATQSQSLQLERTVRRTLSFTLSFISLGFEEL